MVKGDKITLFAYNFPHRKTQDFITKLFVGGYDFKVISQNYKELDCPCAQKPDYSGLVLPDRLCQKLGIEYIVCEHNDSIHHLEGIGIISGARILKKEITKAIPIINFHPAILPSARGLNSVEYSIKNNIPLGITAHIIDEKIDEGTIIFIKKLNQNYSEKSIDFIKQKLLALQVDSIPEAIEKCKNIVPPAGNSQK